MIETKFDTQSFIAPSWEEMGTLSFSLAKQILEANFSYDRIVAIAKGGWTWARDLADLLKVSEVGSIQAKLYTSIGQKAAKLTITQGLPIKIAGEKILLFDDVADSGETFRAVKDYILQQGAKHIETASLFWKPHSVIKPDFYGQKTSAWIVFPHEIREFIEEMGLKWSKQGLSKEQIIARFQKLNLPGDRVDYLVDLLLP